jgi:outer membrane protease
LDEDFPPFIDPYSKTQSETKGKFRYGSVDLGYSVYTDKNFRVGAFTGYHYWSESVDASGCSQVGSDPFICGMPLPNSIKVITEQDRWNAIRFGGVVDVKLTDRLKWTGEFAYAVVSQQAQDTHYFTFGADPASGKGSGFQAETVLTYNFTDKFSVGIGGRWWHYKTDATDSFNQLLQYQTDRYGMFAQGSVKF